MAIELVIGIAVLSVVVGFVLGRYLPVGNTAKTRVTELETALESAQQELSDYKGEVFGQFAETAEKFRALDKSYNDLHRHLAQSSVALCGDAATPLLASPPEQADAALEVAQAPQEDVNAAAPDESVDELADELADELVMEEPQSEAEPASETTDEVPTLTDLDEAKEGTIASANKLPDNAEKTEQESEQDQRRSA